MLNDIITTDKERKQRDVMWCVWGVCDKSSPPDVQDGPRVRGPAAAGPQLEPQSGLDAVTLLVVLDTQPTVMCWGKNRKKWLNGHIFQRSAFQLSIWYSWNIWASWPRRPRLQPASVCVNWMCVYCMCVCVFRFMQKKTLHHPSLKLITSKCVRNSKRKKWERRTERGSMWEYFSLCTFPPKNLQCMHPLPHPPSYFLTHCKIILFIRLQTQTTPPLTTSISGLFLLFFFLSPPLLPLSLL